MGSTTTFKACQHEAHVVVDGAAAPQGFATLQIDDTAPRQQMLLRHGAETPIHLENFWLMAITLAPHIPTLHMLKFMWENSQHTISQSSPNVLGGMVPPFPGKWLVYSIVLTNIAICKPSCLTMGHLAMTMLGFLKNLPSVKVGAWMLAKTCKNP